MAARTYTSVLLAALIATTAVFAGTPTITPTSQLVNEGEDFQLRCEVPETIKAGANENIQFKKRQMQAANPLTISINLVKMDSTYADRVSVIAIPNSEGHAIGYTLTIQGATPHDSGQFGCVLAKGLVADLSEVVWADVSIRQQVQKLDMYAVAANGTKYLLEDGKAYQLTKKEGLHLMCEASGSTPEATIGVWVGDQEITGQLFKQTAVKVFMADRPHMGLITYNTSTISRDIFEIHIPQTISCKAGVEGLEGEKSVSITTLFRYAPIVSCGEVVAFPGYEVKLNCNITSNPRVTDVTWMVRYPNGNNSIIDGVPYYIETKHLPNNVTKTKLVIDHVFENHFANEYFVQATNTEGSTQVAALLRKDPDADNSTGTSSLLTASLLLVTTTALWRLL